MAKINYNRLPLLTKSAIKSLRSRSFRLGRMIDNDLLYDTMEWIFYLDYFCLFNDEIKVELFAFTFSGED